MPETHRQTAEQEEELERQREAELEEKFAKMDREVQSPGGDQP